MNNFTMSSGKAYWHSITNLTCCSIDLKKMQLNGFRTLMVLMLFAFTSTSMFAQQRTTFYEVCVEDRPEGLTVEQALALFPDIDSVECKFGEGEDTTEGFIGVDVSEALQGNDCGWVTIYTYYLLCSEDEEFDYETDTIIAEQKIIYEGGDVEAPVLEVPADVTVECDDVPEVGVATATDNCDDNVNVTYDGEVRTNGDCESNYTLQRTWTATDACGLTTTLTQTITVQDTTAPKLNKGAKLPEGETGLNLCYEVNMPSLGPTADYIKSMYTDNCGDVNVEMERVFKGSDCAWKGYVNFYITDECGNEADTVSIYYNGGDNEAPVFDETPEDITVSCIDLIPANHKLTWKDNCSVSDPKEKGLAAEDRSNLGEACEGGSMTRTWTATDDCGNSVSYTQTITVTPAPPVAFDELADLEIRCEDLEEFQAGTLGYSNGGEGACDISGSVQGVAEDFKENCGTFTVTYSYSDTCNTIEHVQTITVIDNVAPTLVVPADVTVECDNLPEVGEATGSDNCDEEVDVKYDGETRTDGDCADSYTLTRTWTAIDNCGNTTTVSQIITVQDITPPELTIPADVTVECDAIPEVGDASATDNCDADVTVEFLEEKEEPGDCENNYYLIRIWRATDNCGNQTILSQVITVVDTTAPDLTIPADETAQCNAVPAIEDAVVSATDNCDAEVDVRFDGEQRVDGDCADSYTLIRTWIATDNCGNSTIERQTITVVDEIPPNLTIPANVTVECDAVPQVGDASATDECDAEVDVKFDGEQRVDGDCANSYTLIRTWTATDNCGNATISTQTITVVDTTDPVISVPADITVECDEIPENGIATAEDNCDDNVKVDFLKEERIDGDCENNYRLIRIWIAKDDCGNSVTGSQTITVVDTTAPVFAGVGEDEKIECPSAPKFSEPTASDNCDADVTITSVDVDNRDECGVGSVTRTWTATDNCGNSIEASQTITVEDNIAPVISGVDADYTAECPEELVWSDPSASDECDGKPELEMIERSDLDDCGLGTITRTWTATDCTGNESSASQTITIEDNTAPVISGVEAGYTVECPEGLVWSTPSASDTCDAQPGLDYSDSSNLNECGLGTVTRTWTAIDCAGNSSQASQTITIQDTVAPKIEGVTADEVIECPETPKFSEPFATDDCDSAPSLTFVDDDKRDDCGLGSIIRTWTATDCAGNSSSRSQTITIEDNVAPVIDGVGEDFTVECPEDYQFSEPTASDTCDAKPGLDYSDSSNLDECGLGTITRTWTATDCAGNSSTDSQTITIEDNTAPVITEVGQDMTIDCPAEPVFSEPKVSDACDANPKLDFADDDKRDECGLGEVTRTWTAIDCAGNTSTASQTITVQDITDPFFNEDLPQDVTEECDAVTPAVTLTAADTCDMNIEVDFTEQRIDGDCAGRYTLVRTWSAADCAGNDIEHVQTVTVVDTTAPVQIAPIPESINGIIGCASEAPTPMDPTVFATLFEDNCSGVVVTLFSSPVGDDCGWSVMHKYTVKDGCGNLLGDFKVYYSGEDLVDPELHGVPGEVTIDCTDEIPEAAIVTATDNCDTLIKAHLQEDQIIPGDCDGNYDIIRTWTATDACGNSVSATQTIKVRDNDAPVLVDELPEGSNENDMCLPNIEDDQELYDTLGILTESQFAELYNDNCSGVNVSREINLDGDDCKWIMWVRYTVYDDCGNDTSVKLWYHGADMSAPTLTEECINGEQPIELSHEDGAVCPADAGFSIGQGDEVVYGDSWYVAGVEMTYDNLSRCFEDNCATQDELTFTVTNVDEGKPEDTCSKIMTITFDVYDNCENAFKGFTCTFIILDENPPLITEADDVTEECDGTDNGFNTWLANNGNNTAEDDCNDVTWSNDYVPPTGQDLPENECESSVTVTFTATDACGNSISTTSTYTVEDTTAPEFVDADCGTTVELDFDPNNGPGEKEGFTMLGEANGKYYYLSNAGFSGEAAFADAEANGGFVVTVNDAAENQQIYDWAQPILGSAHYFIGYTDAAVEGTFVWHNGETPGYENWQGPQEPNDAGGEDCTEVNFFGTSTWNDIACGSPHRYVLEVSSSSLKEEAKYTDACAGDGTVTDYSDVISSSIIDANQIYIACLNSNGGLITGIGFDVIGTDNDGFATYASNDGTNFGRELTYNSNEGRWEFITNFGSSLVFYAVTDSKTAPCSADDWVITGLATCSSIDVDCFGSDAEYTLERTFTATDGCNETECTVTYTWTEQTNAPTASAESNTRDAEGLDPAAISETQAAPNMGDDRGIELDFTAFPVPFDKEVSVKFNFEFDTDVTIEVHDTKGLLIMSETLKGVRKDSDTKRKLDLSKGADQLFYITVTTNKGSVTKKVVSSNIRRR